jgi:hypothetical protein
MAPYLMNGKTPSQATMKHFSEYEWVDFARNLPSPETMAAMQRHLDLGCQGCAAILRVWQNVTRVTAEDIRFTPPEASERVVKSLVVAPPKTAQKVRLLFDSDLQMVAAGVRGGDSTRQLLYQTDDYFIDLRLEPLGEGSAACLVGQILSRSKKGSAPPAISVWLLEESQLLAETVTNRLGEFHLEFNRVQNLYISINHNKKKRIVLPLDDVQKQAATRERLGPDNSQA